MPEPMLELSIRNMGLSSFSIGKDPESGLGLTVRQEFPFFGKLRLRSALAQKSWERQKENLKRVSWAVRQDLKSSYYDWFFQGRMLALLEKQKALLQQVLELTLQKYTVGSGTQTEIIKAQMEIARMEEMIIPAQQMIRSLKARINLLLNYPAERELPTPILDDTVELQVTLSDLQERCLNNSPMINEANIMLAENEVMVALARKEYYPDFTVSAGWDYKGRMTGMWEAMVGFTIPLYAKRRQGPMLREALARKESAQASLAQEKNQLLAMLRENYFQAETAERLLKLYKNQLLIQAQLAVESALASYKVNKVDFLALLTEIDGRFALEIAYYRELVRFWSSLAVLETMAIMDLSNGKG
jgi:outer membrane protein TolC